MYPITSPEALTTAIITGDMVTHPRRRDRGDLRGDPTTMSTPRQEADVVAEVAVVAGHTGVSRV
jgi:hypothetical protein